MNSEISRSLRVLSCVLDECYEQQKPSLMSNQVLLGNQLFDFLHGRNEVALDNISSSWEICNL